MRNFFYAQIIMKPKRIQFNYICSLKKARQSSKFSKTVCIFATPSFYLGNFDDLPHYQALLFLDRLVLFGPI